MKISKDLSVGKILEKSARTVPEKVALVAGDLRKTFKELNGMSDSLAGAFSSLGFKKGDRVAIYMRNSVELFVSFYALQKLGVIVVWVNPMYRMVESEFILKNSGAKGVVIFRQWDGYDYLDSITAIHKDLPELESIILVGEGQGRGVHLFHDLLTRDARHPFSPPPIDLTEDLSMLIYTSGTTGKPKGAMITHYQAIRAGWEYSRGVDAASGDIFIGILPMTHSYGCGSILIQPVLLGATVVLMEKFEVEAAFKLIEKEKITLQLGSPTHYILELNHPRRKNYDLTSLRAGLIAGQRAPEGLITRVEKELGIYLTSFWGSTEVGPGLGIICP
ncbi:MAG: AMP-binding protein, partial [Desulfobacterales bacterium]|nr:AMP-binding protein [Desulfobacterales bacterium]